jgi:hypothetical protein
MISASATPPIDGGGIVSTVKPRYENRSGARHFAW